MSRADLYRQQAREAEGRAKDSKSLRIGALEHRRAESLYALADTEDWLDGKTTAKSEAPLIPRRIAAPTP